MRSHYAVHLLPCREQLLTLRTHVAELASRFDGPCFVPHVTLMWGVADASERLSVGLADLAVSSQALELAVTGVSESATFTKTLFLEFASTPALDQLHQEVANLFEPGAGYTFRPHLSLLYASLEESQRREVLDGLPPLEPMLKFDTLRLIVARSEYVCRADIEAELELARILLGRSDVTLGQRQHRND